MNKNLKSVDFYIINISICNSTLNLGPAKLLSAELIVYDKHSQCLLTEGEYELILAEIDPERIKMEQKLKNSTWENITIDKTDMVRNS